MVSEVSYSTLVTSVSNKSSVNQIELEKVGGVRLEDELYAGVRPTDLGLQVLGCLLYHQWWSMGATLILDDQELALVLSGTHLPTLEG